MAKMDEKEKWQEVKQFIGNEHIVLGPHYSYVIRKNPRHLLFTLSRYKFAAKLIGSGKHILEVGCSEGLPTMMLAEVASKVTAIDFDAEAIAEAKKNFASDKVEFKEADVLKSRLGQFDAVISLDVVEHIWPENEHDFFRSVYENLNDQGIAIIGTPNKTADQYAAETSRIGHINLYTWDRLQNIMAEYFCNVFMFSANDEVVHTGFYPMAHYLIAVGVGRRKDK